MSQLSRVLDSLLPDLPEGDADLRRRARLVSGFTLALVFWSPVFAVIYARLGAPLLSNAVLLAGAIALLIPYVLRVTGSIELSATLLTIDLHGLLTFLCRRTGGIESPAVAWFVAVPMLGTLLTGYRVGTLWLVATIATIWELLIAVAPETSALRDISVESFHLFKLATMIGITIVVFSLTMIYEELKDQALSSVVSADRAKSEFLANMSHELRTPLTAILGFTDVLLEDAGAASPAREQGTTLQTIRRNGEHLLEVINDILDLSKIEAGKLQVEAMLVSPKRLLDDVVSLMQVRADAGNLTLSVDYSGTMPATISTDPTRLRQILFNLVGNAIKFTKKGSVRLSASLAHTDAGEPRLRIDVADTGIGMTPQQVQGLFEPFTQGDASSTRNFGGTGLGLAISRRLARRLGGDISVKTELGKGSCFRLEIATTMAGAAGASAAPPAVLSGSGVLRIPVAGPSDEELRSLAGLRVLLAEDGPDNRQLIAYVLRKSGIEVALAENGRIAVDSALAALRGGEPFDVILMDIQMPVLDGYSATRELREAGYRLPIVALTAHAMAEDRDKCVGAGCDDYTTKPIRRAELLGILQRLALARHSEGAPPPDPDMALADLIAVMSAEVSAGVSPRSAQAEIAAPAAIES